MNKLDLTVIILTYNEELHIKRCLENIVDIAKDIIVVDCCSTDKTKEICDGFPNMRFVLHEWPGNQAAQFNWAIETLEINTDWILRIDADEYLLPELKEELMLRVPTLESKITGIEFKRRHIFMGRWVKHGIYPVILLRMFKKSCGRYDDRLMDEHIVLSQGESVVFEHDFCDHTLIDVSDYCRKHIRYSVREAFALLNDELCQNKNATYNMGLGAQAKRKHKKKSTYNNMPLFWRSFFYFLYRYILKGGFLDGKEGFLFAFIQGWWYRTLVDAKILEAEIMCGKDKTRMREYLGNKLNSSRTAF